MEDSKRFCASFRVEFSCLKCGLYAIELRLFMPLLRFSERSPTAIFDNDNSDKKRN